MPMRPSDAALLAMQGLVDTDFATPANADVAHTINERARAIADVEMVPGLSVNDFAALLAAGARRAERDERS